MALQQKHANYMGMLAATNPGVSALETLLHNRRSIRVFTPAPVPDTVVHHALELATLSASSSNLQHWQFYRLKQQLPEARTVFLTQAPAKTAPEIIVAVARPDLWKQKNDRCIEQLRQATNPPHFEYLLDYHGRRVPFYYDRGFLNIKGAVRWAVNAIIGLKTPVSRHGFFPWRLREVAVKSTALACQTFMLAITEAGYDSCPMEGFDSRRLRKLLNLPRGAVPVMGIAIGKRSPTYQTTQRSRFAYDEVIVDL